MIVIIIMYGHSLWLVDEGNKIELNTTEIVSPAVKDNFYQKYERWATCPKASHKACTGAIITKNFKSIIYFIIHCIKF